MTEAAPATAVVPPAREAHAGDVRLRRATAADWPGLLRFYKRHHAHRERLLDERLWRWSFDVEASDGPVAAASAGSNPPVPFFVLEAGGEIVGGIGSLDGALNVERESLRAGRPVNFFVDPAMRGLPALRLLRAVQADHDVLVGAYVSDSAMKLLQKSGFVDLSGAVRDHRCTVGIRGGLGADTLVALARRTAALAWRGLALLARPRTAYSVAESLDPRVGDRFARPAGDVRFAKPERYLRWRYERSPRLRPRFVHQFVAGELHAVAVLHVDDASRTAVLLDALSATPGVLLQTALLERALRAAGEAGATLMVTTCASVRLERALRRLLFRAEPSAYGLAVFAQDPARRARLTDASRWHFLLGDTDVY